MARTFDRTHIIIAGLWLNAGLWLKAASMAFIRAWMISALMAINFVHAAEPLRTVIVDPGHGGRDQGVSGSGGAFEKDVSAKLARMIASRLKPAYRVVLTRTGDYQLDPTRRVSIANQHKGDLFISVHTGGAPRYHVNKWGIYTFSRNGGIPGRLPFTPGPEDEGCCLYWNAMQDRHQKESVRFAEVIRSEFAEDSRVPGVESLKAPLRVLEGLDMPAAVIEAGYLTSPQAEIRLNDEAYLDDMAVHVREAVDAFFQTKSSSGERLGE